MKTKIDIIVPIYNRAHCIPKLIKSLEQQTMQDFRVIFVDDGSKDNSCEVLCENLKGVTFEHTVIRKENGGAASARNAGLRAVTADWIAFADSDDDFHPEYIEYMYRAVTESQSDLGICGYQMLVEGKESPLDTIGEFNYKTITPAEAMRHYCEGWLGVYCLIMSREMQQKNNLFFDESCCYCEDAPFITEVIEAAQSVALIDYRLYLYCTNQGSLSRSGSLHKFLSGIAGFVRMEEKMLQSKSDAAKAFNTFGSARYYIATLRKAAIQMAYKDFIALSKQVDFRRYQNQIQYLSGTQKIASYILLLSKTAFYYGMRMLFND